MFDGLDQSVRVLFVAPGDLSTWASRVRPHLAKMADGSGGRFGTGDLIACLASGRMLLWVIVEGVEILCVLVGEVIIYPRAKALRLTGLVGVQPNKWRRLLPFVEHQAKEQFGCTIMESLHQPRHVAFSPGYETTHWLSEKRL